MGPEALLVLVLILVVVVVLVVFVIFILGPCEPLIPLLMYPAARVDATGVIVVTAYSDLDTTVDSYRRGAHEYLAKPFDVDELLAVVERALESRGGGDEAADVPTEEDELMGTSPASAFASSTSSGERTKESAT